MAIAAHARALFGLFSRDGGALVPGVSRARKVFSDMSVPARVDVVVVGGGNIGCIAALALAERNLSVALCEKGVIAGEASGRSLGYVDSLLLDPVKMPAIERSKALWRNMTSRVAADFGYRPSGSLMLFTGNRMLGHAEQWLASVRDAPGVAATLISAEDATNLAPGGADTYTGALFQSNDAVVEPQLFAPAVAEAMRRAGGIVLQGCAVRGVERAAGRVCAAVTERGRIVCDAVVLAGGAWSPVFARSLGLDLPQFSAFSSVVRLTPNAGLLVPILSDRGFALRPTSNGSCDACTVLGSVAVTPSVLRNLQRLRPALKEMERTLEPVFNLSTFVAEWRIPRQWPLDRPSPFEACRILMPETRHQVLESVVANVKRAFPAFGKSTVTEQWAGALSSTIDNMPVVSSVKDWPGLYLGTGFYFGLTMAPSAGEALADLVMERSPQFDLTPYRFSRFADGSKLEFRA